MQKSATSGPRIMSVDCLSKILIHLMQYIFHNSGNQLEKHGFEKEAFKVREHQIALVTKLLCKKEE